jgi:hypothetical protein
MITQYSWDLYHANRTLSPFWSEISIFSYSDNRMLESPEQQRIKAGGLAFETRLPVGENVVGFENHSWSFYESGWTFPAFWGWSKSDRRSGIVNETGGLVKVRMLRSENKKIDYIDLPYLPDWSGLAANTALFSLAWWGVIAGSGALWRGRRRRRGLCQACGYDLHGLPMEQKGKCPECGSQSEEHPPCRPDRQAASK